VSVAVGQEIRVYVSSGQETTTVPVLEGLARDAASDALTSAGLTLGTVTTRNDPDLAQGMVISSDPATGAEVAKGSAVNLVVASGQVTILDYRGYTVEAARTALEAPDIRLTVETIEDPTCPAVDPPIVSQQSLAPGDVPVHSTITLTYCTGAAGGEPDE
jgi:serine/threonine-protein kinase